ncbi:helix-turn-helix domain-containing protein [Pedobacter sp. WC2501]|uniref:helix-turn-helix domain-containing protein n=1 Tax=Pedobacter sp. WC2501 TaxID=3461400 RepID=UPI004045CED1
MDISEIVTKEDIKQLKEDIFEELRRNRFSGVKAPFKKEWLKSYEVCGLLSISKGTLSSYRRRGIVRYSKVGGLMYYKYEDIEALVLKRQWCLS